jgi:hypothetical protein
MIDMRFLFTLLSTALFLTVSSQDLSAYYFDDCCSGRFGVQGALTTGGNLGIGVVHYTEMTEIGATVSGQINNARHSSKSVTPAVFAGLRHSLCECTYFAYGLNAAATFGTYNGERIKCDVGVGPYISLEQMLTSHLMLVFWIDPYQYRYQKTRSDSVSTHNIFSTGGIGLTYLF